PDTCAEETRVQLRTTILTWASDESGPRVYWLTGLAGTGKTTIARSVCIDADAAGKKIISFFISRGDATRNTATRIISTLAHQLSGCHPAVASVIFEASNTVPLPSHYSVAIQTEMLLVRPLHEYAINVARPLFIVIDALDEGTDHEENSDFSFGNGGHMLAALISVLCQQGVISSYS
ncbi:hypothetical protein BKA62DRAFT_624224, partial [Auriculariales sp. MPI-PUGE-AT-0066]